MLKSLIIQGDAEGKSILEAGTEYKSLIKNNAYK
jgi:hypothetical protein